MLNVAGGVWTIKDIVNMQQEINGEGIKDNTKQEISIRKGLTYIMKIKLDLRQEEIKWFKVKLSNGIEQFAFRDDKFILWRLGRILDICGRKNALITPSEERSLIEDFARILPYSIVDSNAWYCNDAFDTRAYKIEQAIHDLSRRSWVEDLYSEELFVKLPAKMEPEKRKRREFYKDQYGRLERWKEKWVSVMEWSSRIRRAERKECLYRCKKDNVAVCTEKDEECFYKTGKLENEMIQRAYKKMKKVPSKYLCQYALYLVITGSSGEVQDEEEKLANVAKQKDIGTIDGCKDACTSLFSRVISHHLKNNSAEDFEYIVSEAIQELETVKKVMMQDSVANERRKESMYPELEILGSKAGSSKIKGHARKKTKEDAEKEAEEDLQHLSNLRRYLNEIKSEEILITDRYR